MNMFRRVILREKKTFRAKIQDIIIVGSNYIFSDFGQSILLPLGWLFSVHYLLFSILMLNNVFEVQFSLTNATWSAFFKGFELYLQLLSPLHKFDLYPDPGTLFGIVDFLMRLFSTYFIYHIIKASRQYSGT